MELNVRPLPIPDPVTQFYWDSAKQGKLAVQGFEGTDILQHPPSPVPEVPGGAEGKPIAVEVSGRGTLFAFTILHQPFHPGFVDAVPMIIGLTELDDAPGVRILTNIAKTRAMRDGRTLPFSSLRDPARVPEAAVDADRFLDPEHPRWPGHWAARPEAWPEDALLARETRERSTATSS